MGPVNRSIYLIEHLSSVLTKQLDKLLNEQLGIRLSQYKILMALEWNPRIEQKFIANSLGQTEASISRQIKLMMKKGILSVNKDEKDKKRHIILATPKGMRIKESAESLIKDTFSKDYSTIPITEMNNSLKILHKKICANNRPGACNHLLGI